jgi:hypothetical protein
MKRTNQIYQVALSSNKPIDLYNYWDKNVTTLLLRYLFLSNTVFEILLSLIRINNMGIGL